LPTTLFVNHTEMPNATAEQSMWSCEGPRLYWQAMIAATHSAAIAVCGNDFGTGPRITFAAVTVPSSLVWVCTTDQAALLVDTSTEDVAEPSV
jgi:hypothetical protein